MRKLLLFIFCAVMSVVAYAVEIPVGYTKGKISGSSGYVLNGKGALSAATRVSPDLVASYMGNEIRGISVGVIDSKYCDSIRVFVASELDGEYLATGFITRKDTDPSRRPANGWNNVPLDHAIAITEEQEFYIGFIFYQRYKCEGISFVGSADENRTYIKRGTGAWEDASSKGYLSVEMLIDGENMPQYDLRLDGARGMLSAPGTLVTSITVTNRGQVVPANFDLTYSAEGYNYVANVTEAIELGSTKTLDITLENVPDGLGFDNPIAVSISRIEGGEDAIPSDNTYSLGVKVKRNVVVEEFTGTGCGWCPRGLVGMEKMRNKYGDRFVGIGIHQYNASDPMYPTRYKNLGFNSAPSCLVNRTLFTDPYDGTGGDICDDFEAAMEEGAFASVVVTGTYNEDKTSVDATATITAQDNLEGLQLTFVLIADSLTGTSSSWKQQNYYASYSASQFAEDLAQFCAGGEFGQTSFFWLFNDVAIGTYYDSGQYEMGIGNLAQGQSVTVDYTLDMPTKKILRDAIDYDDVAVIAMLLDSQGRVMNAGKYYMSGVDPTGIENVANDTTSVREVARYTIDGRRIMTPQSGLNIVKLSNGRSYKIMVK